MTQRNCVPEKYWEDIVSYYESGHSYIATTKWFCNKYGLNVSANSISRAIKKFKQNKLKDQLTLIDLKADETFSDISINSMLAFIMRSLYKRFKSLTINKTAMPKNDTKIIALANAMLPYFKYINSVGLTDNVVDNQLVETSKQMITDLSDKIDKISKLN